PRLDVAQLVAESRLRQVQSRRRLRHAASFGDARDQAQVTDFEIHSMRIAHEQRQNHELSGILDPGSGIRSSASERSEASVWGGRWAKPLGVIMIQFVTR